MSEFVNVSQKNGKKIKVITIIIAVIILLALLVFSCVTIIPAGYKGVLLNMGAVSGIELSEGINFKAPFIQNVQAIDTRVRKLESNANASASKDLQSITSSIAVNYRVDSSKVNDLYQNIGMDYESTVITPAISECMKAVTSQYTAEELITKRTAVSAAMKEFLQGKLSEKYIIVDSFNVLDFEFSEAFNKAIEEKQIAEQNSLKAQYDLDRIKTEAEQTIQKAQGEAEAMKIKNTQLSENIIKLEYINKWDGKMPTYYGGEGGLLLNMEDSAKNSSPEKKTE